MSTTLDISAIKAKQQAERQTALEADLLAALRKADRGGGRGLVVPAEYLESIITR